mgnify:CR=1 FL=1
MLRFKMAPRSSLKRYQIVIEKVAQIKSEGKKSLGFGKNDLNIMSYLRFLDIKTCGGLYVVSATASMSSSRLAMNPK